MRALILDDSRAARAILGRLLRELSFEVSEAPDADSAERILGGGPAPDLALVDWNLPGRNGLDFVRALRANRLHDSVRVIMVTTEVENEQILQALQAGANEYLMKPFTRETLESKLALMGLSGRPHG